MSFRLDKHQANVRVPLLSTLPLGRYAKISNPRGGLDLLAFCVAQWLSQVTQVSDTFQTTTLRLSQGLPFCSILKGSMSHLINSAATAERCAFRG
jgi:hypothetical protein